jgi:hypothetical protein
VVAEDFFFTAVAEVFAGAQAVHFVDEQFLQAAEGFCVVAVFNEVVVLVEALANGFAGAVLEGACDELCANTAGTAPKTHKPPAKINPPATWKKVL